GATKLLRGELFEAASTLDFIRLMVLGPMLQRNAGVRQRNVRHIEGVAGAAQRLIPTMPPYQPEAIAAALRRAAALYVELRQADPPPSPVPGMPGLLLD